MLRIVPSKASSNAKAYFNDGLSREDYYSGDERIPGTWFGKGANLLGLSGEVGKNDFAALCDNLHPKTGEPLTPRKKANRRVAYDFNFHCPKSVSVLYSLGFDDRILGVFHDSVRHTMNVLEPDSQTRVRISGANSDRTTGNLTWAEFTHFTARPVAGIADPHLHAHCYTFNLTFDHTENRWKAAQFGGIKSQAPFHEARFMAKLAEGLRELGYEIEPKGKYWEIKGVPNSVIRKFSKRSQEIDRIAAERNIDNAVEKAGLGAKTRRSKKDERSRAETKQDWHKRMTKDEWDECFAAHGKAPLARIPDAARRAVAHAIELSFERSAVVPESLFMGYAMAKAYGKATESDIRREMERVLISRTVNDKPYVTTLEVFAEESRMIKLALNGRGKYERLKSDRAIDPLLNAQQSAAVRHALESRDFVSIIEGGPGTGKTTLLQQLKRQLNAAQYPVSQMYLSPTTKGRERLFDKGFGQAATVAGFLTNPALRTMQNVGVVVVDEAGLLGTKPMLALMEYCWNAGHRLVLVGDSKQNTSQSRGSPFRSLRDHAGVGSARVDEIIRQTGYLKEVVGAISEGRVGEGLRRLDQMGSIREATADEAAKLAAEDYVFASRAKVKAILITPSRYERAATEPRVREMLVADKQLGKARTVTQLVPKEMTQAAKARHQSYEEGDILEFHQNTKRLPFMPKGSHFAAGTRWKVVGHNLLGFAKIERVQSIDPFGNFKAKEPYESTIVPISAADRFTVFQEKEIEIRVGEKIRITKNGRTHSKFDYVTGEATNWATFPGRYASILPKRRLINGDEHTVKKFIRGGHLELDNGLIVREDFGHIEYGYCSTAVEAQGRDLDRAILVQTARSGQAAHYRQLNVSLSRGAHSAMVYTDSKEKFFESAEREAKDWNATDLLRGVEPPNLVTRSYEMEPAHWEDEHHERDAYRDRDYD